MADHPRTAAIVMAAGEGTRLRSRLPKVLHRAAGRALVTHVLAALAPAGLSRAIVIVSKNTKDAIADEVRRAALGLDVHLVVQDPPRGTGDAVRVALGRTTPDIDRVLVLAGDGPLIRTETIQRLLDDHDRAEVGATILTATLEDPTGYGRVVRDGGTIARVVEERDATPDQRAIREVNCGGYVFQVDALSEVLPRMTTENAQKEYYLTETVGLLLEEGRRVTTFEVPSNEAEGVNTRAQLAEAARELRERTCRHWMDEGVTIVDPASTYIDTVVTIGRDTVIHPGTFLEGDTHIGERAEVGPQTRIVDSKVGDGASVTFSVVRGSDIGPEAGVGPFASLRPGTRLERGARAGTFVETKQTTIGESSKANHLAYLGDATIGAGVNVGAGTITCNWDGREKHETVIEDEAYIGSDTMLVAPTRIGKGAATGAGSVVRGDVPDGALAVGVPARIIEGKGNKMRKPPDNDPAEPRE